MCMGALTYLAVHRKRDSLHARANHTENKRPWNPEHKGYTDLASPRTSPLPSRLMGVPFFFWCGSIQTGYPPNGFDLKWLPNLPRVRIFQSLRCQTHSARKETRALRWRLLSKLLRALDISSHACGSIRVSFMISGSFSKAAFLAAGNSVGVSDSRNIFRP